MEFDMKPTLNTEASQMDLQIFLIEKEIGIYSPWNTPLLRAYQIELTASRKPTFQRALNWDENFIDHAAWKRLENLVAKLREVSKRLAKACQT